ncbi:hypothetical protein [Spongiactinospora sp. TRM90649]|uniref:hypothetical protein n=1 Tax=Spongiactinospora sp. TRM90649 TaxID=3031114 RepID=UPI0023FA395F|nr:hypothetical protein [Spongiactinospora sp. TRM90649]MDF5752579.1 hypothetical protein [Spongiactinospora sp. TRM90649]
MAVVLGRRARVVPAPGEQHGPAPYQRVLVAEDGHEPPLGVRREVQGGGAMRRS